MKEFKKVFFIVFFIVFVFTFTLSDSFAQEIEWGDLRCPCEDQQMGPDPDGRPMKVQFKQLDSLKDGGYNFSYFISNYLDWDQYIEPNLRRSIMPELNLNLGINTCLEYALYSHSGECEKISIDLSRDHRDPWLGFSSKFTSKVSADPRSPYKGFSVHIYIVQEKLLTNFGFDYIEIYHKEIIVPDNLGAPPLILFSGQTFRFLNPNCFYLVDEKKLYKNGNFRVLFSTEPIHFLEKPTSKKK